jgi:hypothetical protein
VHDDHQPYARARQGGLGAHRQARALLAAIRRGHHAPRAALAGAGEDARMRGVRAGARAGALRDRVARAGAFERETGGEALLVLALGRFPQLRLHREQAFLLQRVERAAHGAAQQHAGKVPPCQRHS